MSDEQKTILWTRPMLDRFKKVYKQAVAAKVETFMFEGNEYVPSYAGYLIEFLEGRL